MKPNIFLTAIIYASALTACMHQRHVIIATATNGNSKKIEYTGIVAFSKTDTGSVTLSPRSWLKYKDDEVEVKVDCDESGHQYYSLNGSDKTLKPTAKEKSALVRAGKFAAEHALQASHS